MRGAVLLLVLVTSVPLAEARPRGHTGKLEVHSTTKGATVVVDGKEVGITPMEEPLALPVGKHTLRVYRLGYAELLDVFTVQPGQLTTVEVDLLPFAGVLFVAANVEGAKVFIDGKFEGLTPLQKEVLIGRRTVRVVKVGYYDFITTISSIAGKTKRLKATLTPLPVGSTPYRPRPLSPPKWYERWYVWAGAAGGVAAVTLAIVLPVTMRGGDVVRGWSEKYEFINKPR